MIVEVILISFAILMCFSSNFYGMIQMSRSKLYTYYCVLELSEPLKLHDGNGNTVDCYSGEQVKMMGFEEDMIVISSFQHGNEWFPTSERISMSSVKNAMRSKIPIRLCMKRSQSRSNSMRTEQ